MYSAPPRAVESWHQGGMPSGLCYECTHEQEVIQQHAALVRQCYAEELGVHLPEHEPDSASDQRDHILVARLGPDVVGGARVSISPQYAPVLLPMERDDFLLPDLLPEYALAQQSYAELGRLAVARAFRGHGIVRHLVVQALALVHKHDCKYGFWVAPLPQARYYQRVLHDANMPAIIHEEIRFPACSLYQAIPSRIFLTSCAVPATVQSVRTTTSTREGWHVRTA